jgi:glucose/arabinose dehydrogenase/ubiquinone/menaquinone biosynthesis C-methylase UbiE
MGCRRLQRLPLNESELMNPAGHLRRLFCHARFVLCLSVAVATSLEASQASAADAANTLTLTEERLGWQLLFDGESLENFRGYRQEQPGAGWAVEDGTIVRKANGAGDLITREQFDSFELQLEYRISPAGNSGLMFHVTEDNNTPWKSGPEVQIIDNVDGKDPQKAGWLYQLYQPAKPRWVSAFERRAGLVSGDTYDATRPAGEWNHLYLRVTPQAGEVCLNGVKYYNFVVGSDDWNRRVAQSKFADMEGFGKAGRGHIALQDHGDEVAFRSLKVRLLPDGEATRPVDQKIAVTAEPAFPEMEWEGWSPTGEDGKPAQPMRPLLVTHAGDGTGRRFVLDQAGMVHVIAKDDQTQASLFLDLRPQTAPWGKANEEGLLGLAFHPKFAENGEFFLCYSVKPDDDPSVRREHVSRFRVSEDDPNRADPASEEVLITFEQPFENHNGGSITFGNDGYLYIALGDGGSANDPLGNGQNLANLNGSVVRIDVDHTSDGRAYAIPSDNPFVDVEGARPEIFAYGFRNIWQISNDPKTGHIWVGDVGQDLWEEVNIVERGGNYGWSIREGTQPFSGVVSAVETVDPVWIYDHREGKSITGGHVYNGSELPMLSGRYVFGDYVSGRVWALALDPETGKADNQEISWNGLPVYGFGVDEAGEMYVTTASPTGQGVYRLVRDASVVPVGINDNFLDPELDAEAWMKRFEVESREVFAGRVEVMKALGLEPGDRIADIGSGTGLYLSAFSGAVGKEGGVYAVDISPKFIEFIRRRVVDENLENVRVVASTERSASLAAESVDHVFICDTYHHFSYYGEMLDSIREGLAPGGQLVVIDFERIPGTSRDWLLTHVRAGKEQVRAEIEQAGFEFVEEVEVPAFAENYLLRFRKPVK